MRLCDLLLTFAVKLAMKLFNSSPIIRLYVEN